MKKERFWFRASLIVSSMLVVFGAYPILNNADFIYGLIHISLGVIIGLNSWIKLFKRKNE